MHEIAAGVSALLRGFALWRTRPGTMALGLIPAALVGIAFTTALVALGIWLPQLAVWTTPFADDWPMGWALVLRITLGTASFGAAVALCVVTFTATTLVVGEPAYDRIWRTVERDTGSTVPETGEGFWRTVGDGIRLVVRGVLVALLAGAAGLVPIVGGVAATVVGLALTGALLADELTARALSARGIDRAGRRRLRRARRSRTLAFGIATQVCFLVPLGAVLTMPAAVAGSTLLARELMEGAAPR